VDPAARLHRDLRLWWAASAGQGLFALVDGCVADAWEVQQKRWYAIGLLIVVFLITAVARRISRALELSNWMMVGFVGEGGHRRRADARPAPARARRG
jgi:hypothetical protein